MSTSCPPAADEMAVELPAGLVREFAALVRTHDRELLLVARRVLGHHHDAEDAVQEGLLRAYRALGQFDGRARLATWLHRIVVNSALLLRRQRRNREERGVTDEVLLEESPQAAPGASVADPVASATSAELISRVFDLIDGLPERHGEIIRLRDLQQRTTRETASLLDLSETAVRVRLHRARRELTRRLVTDCLEDEALVPDRQARSA